MSYILFGLLLVVVYIIVDLFVIHGPFFRKVFGNLSFLFYKYRGLGRLFRIRYVQTDTWDTTREQSTVFFDQTLGKLLLGRTVPFGDADLIHSLKMRQRQSSRPLTLMPYVEQLVGKRISVRELEPYLIAAWISELSEGYSIPPPDEDKYVAGILAFRQLVSTSSLIGKLKFVYYNFPVFRYLRTYWDSLAREESLIMMVPFLTTIDTSLLNFAASEEPVRQSILT